MRLCISLLLLLSSAFLPQQDARTSPPDAATEAYHLADTPAGSHALALQSNGKPVVALFTDDALQLIVCHSITCGERHVQQLDSGAMNNRAVDMTLTRDNHPVIVYQDEHPLTAINVIQCRSLQCAAADYRTVSTPGLLMQHVHLRLTQDDNPFVSYQIYQTGDVHLLHCDAAECQSHRLNLPDVHSFSGVDMALRDDDRPVFIYQPDDTPGVWLVQCDALDCPSPGIRTIIDRHTGKTSLALTDDNRPLVAYSGTTDGWLRLLVCDWAACQNPTDHLIREQGGVDYVALSVTPDNHPVLAYSQATPGGDEIAVSVCDSLACDTVHSTHPGASGVSGLLPDVQVTAGGQPIITHYNVTHSRVMLVVCRTRTCQP
jgi:hypothetical protein